jgi:hypothetical protein
MAFNEQTLAEAWERSNGQCECEQRTHSHFRTPCLKHLSWKARGMAIKEGWEARHITTSGGDGVHNCEILCWSCYKSTLGYSSPSLFSDLHTGPTQQVHLGDYIKLESGQEGRVTEILYDSVCIKALDGNEIVVSNSEIRRIVVNYGHTAKKAKEPFRFYTLSLLRKMTGLKARNLTELASYLKQSPDGVIYYHTHQFLQEHHYLVPEPPNDFAVWAAGSLGDEVLGERLASVNPFSFKDLVGVREKLVNIIEEHLTQYTNHREAMEGNEFYFVKSARFVFPTPYVVYDLREFVGALSKVSLGSLYLHIFESRLGSEKGLNDFSIWLIERLGEEELGRIIARIDPYSYTLEGLRSSLIKLIEKHIK